MKHEIELYELIEKYLQGNLHGEELKNVEKQIQSDPDFALEVEKHRESQNFIFERAMVDMKEQIGKIHRKNTSTGNGKSGWRNLFFFLDIALLIFAIILLISNRVKQAEVTLMPCEQQKNLLENSDNNQTSSMPIHKKTEVFPQQKKEIDVLPFTDTLNTIKPVSLPKEPIAAQLIPRNSDASVEDTRIQPQLKNTESESQNGSQESTSLKADCENVEISADVESENSCNNKPTGKIRIDRQSLIGGEPPYRLSIDGGENYFSDLSANNLAPSLYKIVVKDANDCVGMLNDILIKTIDCSYEFIFSPDKGEVWKIPSIETTGEIKIYSKQGKLVFLKEFDMAGDYEWDGRTNSGNDLPMGAYMFVLIITDNETITGNVTIVR